MSCERVARIAHLINYFLTRVDGAACVFVPASRFAKHRSKRCFRRRDCTVETGQKLRVPVGNFEGEVSAE